MCFIWKARGGGDTGGCSGCNFAHPLDQKGVGLTPEEKAVKGPCRRDPCPFGPARCVYQCSGEEVKAKTTKVAPVQQEEAKPAKEEAKLGVEAGLVLAERLAQELELKEAQLAAQEKRLELLAAQLQVADSAISGVWGGLSQGTKAKLTGVWVQRGVAASQGSRSSLGEASQQGPTEGEGEGEARAGVHKGRVSTNTMGPVRSKQHQYLVDTGANKGMTVGEAKADLVGTEPVTPVGVEGVAGLEVVALSEGQLRTAMGTLRQLVVDGVGESVVCVKEVCEKGYVYVQASDWAAFFHPTKGDVYLEGKQGLWYLPEWAVLGAVDLEEGAQLAEREAYRAKLQRAGEVEAELKQAAKREGVQVWSPSRILGRTLGEVAVEQRVTERMKAKGRSSGREVTVTESAMKQWLGRMRGSRVRVR